MSAPNVRKMMLKSRFCTYAGNRQF
jgi:hypothetical protein